MASLRNDPDFLVKCWGAERISSSVIQMNSSMSFGGRTGFDPINVSIPLLLGLLVEELIGFSVFALLFGLSLAISVPCLYYLVKNWRRDFTYITNSVFSILLSSFNVATFIMRIYSLTLNITKVQCPRLAYAFPLDFWNGDSLDPSSLAARPSHIASITFPTVFLWISDAFLLFRLWIIWNRNRVFLIFPILVFFASVVTGIVFMVEAIYESPKASHGLAALDQSASTWIPALGFSFGLDFISTSMIAGRLITHERRIRKLYPLSTKTHSFFPVVVIFIESAVLSFLSKVLQLVGSSSGFNPLWAAVGLNIFVIPICTISSNLIVIRRALGFDVTKALRDDAKTISSVQIASNLSRLGVRSPGTGGFEATLANTVGDGAGVWGKGRGDHESEDVSRSHEMTVIGTARSKGTQDGVSVNSTE